MATYIDILKTAFDKSYVNFYEEEEEVNVKRPSSFRQYVTLNDKWNRGVPGELSRICRNKKKSYAKLANRTAKPIEPSSHSETESSMLENPQLNGKELVEHYVNKDLGK